MAQFKPADFGGIAQWTPAMSMVGDMFNSGLKAKLNVVGNELVEFIIRNPSTAEGHKNSQPGSGNSSAGGEGRWPADFVSLSCTGSQNDMYYAAFANKKRLAIRDKGKLTIYDMGPHQISGFSQSQSTVQNLSFISQDGVQALSDLTVVGQ
jgi:hypothetical protein